MASASETLLSGGQRSAAVAAARAVYDQSIANYRQTVLAAFQNVEDELASLRILGQQIGVNRLIASVALLQALGGGWESSQLPSRHELQKLHLIPD